MSIEWTTITWYSRLITIILFVGVLPVLNFYIGVKYQETTDALQQSVDVQNPLYVCPIPPKNPSRSESTTTPAVATTTLK